MALSGTNQKARASRRGGGILPRLDAYCVVLFSTANWDRRKYENTTALVAAHCQLGKKRAARRARNEPRKLPAFG